MLQEIDCFVYSLAVLKLAYSGYEEHVAGIKMQFTNLKLDSVTIKLQASHVAETMGSILTGTGTVT